MKKIDNKELSVKIVEVLQREFPKFSKITLCMVRNKAYGVTLSPAAKKYLKEYLLDGNSSQKRLNANKKERNTKVVRISNEVYDSIKKMADESNITISEYINKNIKL